MRKALKITAALSMVAALGASAGGFDEFYQKFGELEVNKGYSPTNGDIKKRTKKHGYYASVKEVENALEGKKIDGKPVVVVDSRTKVEQMGLTMDGVILANLRGWNKAFEKPERHSDNIGAVYSFCRTGTDQADNIIKLQWLFQGKAKVFGLRDMVYSCYPTVSQSGNVLDAKLNEKGVYVQNDGTGKYYEVNCPQVKDVCTPIAVHTDDDIEVARTLGDELPKTMTMKNKKLDKEVTVYRGADNNYYKKACWDTLVGK